jgi:glycosyltransferase involved in cell wall biosynthesis
MPPDDATASVVAQFPGVRYIVEKCAELDFARNRAWVEAHGEWIAYLDDDVTVDRWWFEGLQEAGERIRRLRRSPVLSCRSS